MAYIPDASLPPNVPVFGSSNVPPTVQTSEPNGYKFAATHSDVAIDWQDNMLDQYDLPTYHFKFFMVPPIAQTNGTYLDPRNQTVIAESGVSDYTIDDVTINTVCQPSYEIGTGTATSFNFKITEPSGASLLDKLYYTSLDLGIGNWAKSPYYLELSFRARDPDSSIPAGLGTSANPGGWVNGKLSQLRWVWPIAVTSTKANITKVGTVYDFAAAYYGDFAFSNAVSVVQHNVVLENVRTVGDAIRILQVKLNRDSTENLLLGHYVPDVFEFDVDPELAELPVVPQNNNKNSSRQNSFFDFDKKTFSFNTATSIEHMINAILATTSYFQEKAKEAGSTNDSAYSEAALQKIWRIIPHSVPYKYDVGRQANAHYNKYYIVKFEKGNLPTSASAPRDNTGGKSKYDEYKRKGILRKKYEYIFTGQNDQVYEFDITLNNGFAVAQSRFAGLYYNSSHSDPGIVQQDDLDKKKAALDAVSRYIGFFNDSTKTESDRESARIEYEQKVAAARVPSDNGSQPGLTDTELDGIQRYLDHAKNPERSLVAAKAVVAVNHLKAGASPEIAYATPSRFVSDQERLSADAIIARSEKLSEAGELQTPGPTIRPVSSVSAPTEKELSDGVEDKADSDRNATSAIFSQMMSQNAGGDYGSIRLKVKGDPYWLTRNPVTTTDLIEPPPTIDSIYAQLESTANTNISTAFMLVRLRTPKLFMETGSMVQDPFTEVDTISAVYSVNTIVHSFVKGVFSQELSASIDPPIEISKFLEAIEGSERAISDNALSAANLPTNPIPASAVNTSPVQGVGSVGVLKNGAGEILKPGNTLGQTLSEIENFPFGIPPTKPTLPGINQDMIHSIGKNGPLKAPGIPGISAPAGLPPTANLERILSTSIARAKRGP